MASGTKSLYETHAAQRKREVVTMDLALKRMEDVLKILATMKEQQDVSHAKLSDLTATMESMNLRLAALEMQSKEREKVTELKTSNQHRGQKDEQCKAAAKTALISSEINNSSQDSGSGQVLPQMLADSSHPSHSSPALSESTIADDIHEGFCSTTSRLWITIAIHLSSSRILSSAAGAVSHGNSDTLHDPSFPLATLEFQIFAQPCTTLDLFVEYMTGQANACEVQMQGQESGANHMKQRFFESQFGKLRNTLLVFNNYNQAGLCTADEELWARKNVLPTVLKPDGPNANDAYNAWYERNIVSNCAAEQMYNIEAIFECDGAQFPAGGCVGDVKGYDQASAV